MEGILNSYAVAVPDAIVWTVVPPENFLGEPKRVNDKMLPSDWSEYLGDPNHTYYFANGSEHVIRSGFTAGSLKQGEAVLVDINEAQQVPADSYRNTLGATIDGGRSCSAPRRSRRPITPRWSGRSASSRRLGPRSSGCGGAFGAAHR